MVDLPNLNNNNANIFGAMQSGINKRLSSVGGLQHQLLNYHMSMALLNQHHTNTMEATNAQHGHNKELMGIQQQHESGMAEAEHGRRQEFLTHATKHAQPGTGVTFQSGDMSTSFTKKALKPRTPKAEPVAEPSAPAKPSGPSVTRDKKTGRIVSLKK